MDGRLRVSKTNISKETVNPYLGLELISAGAVGLEADKIYQMYRPAEELKKAAESFKNVQLLIDHSPVSSDITNKHLVVGAIGSDVYFEKPYLIADVIIWDNNAIQGIENKQKVELSSAYHFTADMTPGTFNGVKYDGVLRDIVGNHVALVEIGRAGHDVVLSDSGVIMRDKQRETLLSGIRQGTSQDFEMSPEQLDAIIDALLNIKDGEPEVLDGGKKLEAHEMMKVRPPEPDIEQSKTELRPPKVTMMDEMRKTLDELYQAREKVIPLVGKVAFDTASEVYGFTLDQVGIQTKDVHESAFPLLVDMYIKYNKSEPEKPSNPIFSRIKRI